LIIHAIQDPSGNRMSTLIDLFYFGSHTVFYCGPADKGFKNALNASKNVYLVIISSYFPEFKEEKLESF
jgi:hypothetical protein